MLEVRRLVLILEGDNTYMKTLGNLELPGNPSHRLVPDLLKKCPVTSRSLSMRQWCPGAGLPRKERQGAYGLLMVCSNCGQRNGDGRVRPHKWFKPPHGEDCRCQGTGEIVISDRERLAVLLDAAKNIGDVTFLQLSSEEVILKTHHHGYGETQALALADAFYAYHASYRPED